MIYNWFISAHRVNSRRTNRKGVSPDKPAVDPKRHVAMLKGARVEVFCAPVYLKDRRPASQATLSDFTGSVATVTMWA
jgi:hypothetical protein